MAMSLNLGNFSKLDDGSFAGPFRMIDSTTQLSIVPIDKTKENAPDFRVFAQRREVGSGWSHKARTSGKDYLILKVAAPEFGPHMVRCRLVELEVPAEDGTTHVALWDAR